MVVDEKQKQEDQPAAAANPESVPEKKEKEKDKPEPTFELLLNPARVTKPQLSLISFDVDPRYIPVTEGVHGIVLLKDTTPAVKEELLPALPQGGLQEEENDAEPPEPFEFLG